MSDAGVPEKRQSAFHLALSTGQLPADLEGLSGIDLLGDDYLRLYRERIRSARRGMKGKKVPSERLEALKRLEAQAYDAAQDVAKITFAAKLALGEYFDSLDKSKGGRPKKETAADTAEVSPYQEALEEFGTERDARRLQELYHHKDEVEAALKEAQAAHKVPTISFVLSRIKEGPVESKRSTATERVDLDNLMRGYTANMKSMRKLLKNSILEEWGELSAQVQVTFTEAAADLVKLLIDHYGPNVEEWFMNIKSTAGVD